MRNDKDLNRWSISVHDFEDSNRYLKEFEMPRVGYTQKEALLTCAVLCHARPFTGNEKKEIDASSKIQISDFQRIAGDMLTLHERIMVARNKAVAHAEWNKYPTRFNPKTKVISSRRYNILSDHFDTKLLFRINEELIQQLHHKRADTLKRLSD